MEMLAIFLSIIKQCAANLIGLLKSNDKADTTQTLPLVNKDLLAKYNINHGIVLKPNEQQTLNQRNKYKANISHIKHELPLVNKKVLTKYYINHGIVLKPNEQQTQTENSSKLVLLKLPSCLSYFNGWQLNKCVRIIEQIVHTNLHTTLGSMFEELKQNYILPPHETTALERLFKRQLKKIEWQNRDSHCYTREDIPTADVFHLIEVTRTTGKITLYTTVNHIDFEPIVDEAQKHLFWTNFIIGLCFWLQWPAHCWTIRSAMKLTERKRIVGFEIGFSIVFVVYSFSMAPLVLSLVFVAVNKFIKKLFIVHPAQATRLQKTRLFTALAILIAQSGCPLIELCFQLTPLFDYIFPQFIPGAIISILFLVNILLQLVLPYTVDDNIMDNVKYYEKRWRAQQTCSEEKLAEELWRTMDENGYKQMEIVKELQY